MNQALITACETAQDDWSNAVKALKAVQGLFPSYMILSLEAGIQRAAMTELWKKAQSVLTEDEIREIGITDEVAKTYDCGMIIYQAWKRAGLACALGLARALHE